MADAAAQSTTERGKVAPNQNLYRRQTHTALAKIGQEEDEKAIRSAERPVQASPTPAVGMGNRKRAGKPDVVQDAISRLGATAEAYGEVYNACSHTYLMVRDSATQDLGVEVARGNLDALERLLEQMQDTSEGFVREQAAKAAGSAAMDNDAICGAILPLLNHADHNVRRTALIAVKKRLHSERVLKAASDALEGRVAEFDREKDIIEAVSKMFEDMNGRCRFAAVDAFAKLIEKFHYDAIACANSVLEDDEEWVRRFAADLLGKVLLSCQNFYRNLSPVAVPNVKEGFNELIGSGIRCYQVGLTLKGGGDAYMRRIAVQGLCVVACSEQVCQFDAPTETGSDDEALSDAKAAVNGQEKKEKRKYYTPKDAIKVLWQALKDDVSEIRKTASETLLSLAAQGVPTAIDAIMWNVDTVITDGIDMPGLGSQGTPEYAVWCETLGDAGKEYEALIANVKGAEESHKLWLANKADEERRKRIALDIQVIEDAASEGDWQYCREIAFPESPDREVVLQREAKDPERRAIRVAAAEGLQRIAAKFHMEAAKTIADNYLTFFDLCDMTPVADSAADHIKDQLARDVALLPKPRPVPDHVKAKELEAQMLQVEDRNARTQAAANLSQMAEMGDDAAAQVILDNSQAYLVAMQHAGIFTGKIINNGEALRRCFPKGS